MRDEQTPSQQISPCLLAGLWIADFSALNLSAADTSPGKGSEETWWSLRPLKKPPVPSIPKGRYQNWPRTPIDQFILAKLLEKDLHPSPPADKRTLLRRLYLDLIGLPPTPEEM